MARANTCENISQRAAHKSKSQKPGNTKLLHQSGLFRQCLLCLVPFGSRVFRPSPAQAERGFPSPGLSRTPVFGRDLIGCAHRFTHPTSVPPNTLCSTSIPWAPPWVLMWGRQRVGWQPHSGPTPLGQREGVGTWGLTLPWPPEPPSMGWHGGFPSCFDPSRSFRLEYPSGYQWWWTTYSLWFYWDITTFTPCFGGGAAGVRAAVPTRAAHPRAPTPKPTKAWPSCQG